MQRQRLRLAIIENCRLHLIAAKSELLNQTQANRQLLMNRERGGDEGDQSTANFAENQVWANQRRLRQRLVEIESALARIERGTFGLCEETEEMIEEQRLLAIPWTRLSIEGAEIREAKSKQRAFR